MHGTKLIISDTHSGIKVARKAITPLGELWHTVLIFINQQIQLSFSLISTRCIKDCAYVCYYSPLLALLGDIDLSILLKRELTALPSNNLA
jgi:hypothetical protein